MQVDYQTLDGLYQSASGYGCGTYEPSITSSASSSQASVFSDEASVQSSIASSISDDFRCNQEDARDRAYAQTQLQQKAALDSYNAQPPPSQQQQCRIVNFLQNVQGAFPPPPSYADVTSVPAQQRQHPRRCSLSRNQKPPTLQRQCERKVNFVENLVGSRLHEDSATQMVEVIWPLSVPPCSREGNSEKGVLPLRTYIEETLRRSKTSYSTLQVALYYLVLIKPFVPKRDFTQEQRMDCPASRALMCGRRMFLAALILASKYLQDRNYSAKAWSKMSGLKVCEINSNERTFLSKVNWKLHIPEPIFKRWTEIVLDFTPHMQPPPSPGGFNILPPSWKAIIPLLTPELDRVPASTGWKHKRSIQCMGNYGLPTPVTPTKPTINFSQQLESMSQEGTPTPTTIIPRFLEPNPNMEPPAVPRMGPLPTPQMTPTSIASSTPAASTCGAPRRPSICAAMAMAQKAGFNRCATEVFPPPSSRRPSIASSASTFSSPESMISDRSRSSRASSISSVSTTSSLPPNNRACLARQATCRNAGLPLRPFPVDETDEKENTALPYREPQLVSNDGEAEPMVCNSPEPADFSISEKVLTRPDKHSKHAPSQQLAAATSSSAEKRKRARNSHGGRRSDLQEEVRQMLEEAEEDAALERESEQMETDECVKESPAVGYARGMLTRRDSNSSFGGRAQQQKEVQPPPALSRSGSGRQRVVVERRGGEKRGCCSLERERQRGLSPGALFGEVA
ncbi:PHO85 cyclin-5 [Saxophila tyrrhenica]|uniref:PHO85 cyclin-5 n=1 Tax=Saxophila tyrrhenica TaxID=1690608 RepID=A0AAV9PNP9_9PEZI|nr:PHO85 cyclin-5 [Saxophila tyrrhenica]